MVSSDNIIGWITDFIFSHPRFGIYGSFMGPTMALHGHRSSSKRTSWWTVERDYRRIKSNWSYSQAKKPRKIFKSNCWITIGKMAARRRFKKYKAQSWICHGTICIINIHIKFTIQKTIGLSIFGNKKLGGLESKLYYGGRLTLLISGARMSISYIRLVKVKLACGFFHTVVIIGRIFPISD